MYPCVFCEESFSPESAHSFLGESWPYPNRILFSDDNVFVVPGYGPQVYPYALVITHRHITSVADTTVKERESILKSLYFLQKLKVYSSDSLCVFEHGGCGYTKSSCIDHCHLHVVDSTLNLYERIIWNEDTSDVVLSKYQVFPNSNNYLFAGIYNGIEIEGKLMTPSIMMHQYFRQVIATLINSASWDWRTGMNIDYMIQLMDSVQSIEGKKFEG